MTKGLFIAICTELGMSYSDAEKGWDKHPELCKNLTSAQVKKIVCICTAVEQYFKGGKITTPGITVDQRDGVVFMQYDAQDT